MGSGANWDVKPVQIYTTLNRLEEAGLVKTTSLAQILLTDKTIMHLEAGLRWLDIIEMRLETIPGQPFPQLEMRCRGRPRKDKT